MEYVTSNLLGRPRRQTLNGREYIVAPLSMIVPGVLSGSQGALFYPPDEVAADPSIWNHVPITNGHPVVKNGEHVSAKDPTVLDKQGIGYVYRAAYNGKKLVAEGWFDVQKTKQVDNEFGTDVLERLDRGEAIELSTGLHTENELAENGAEHEGKSYHSVARNYRADHLAILPRDVGACSVGDGCGVNVNERQSIWNRLGRLLGLVEAPKPKEQVANAGAVPSDDVEPDKACQILKDGSVRGHPLTEDQRGMFGAACGSTKNKRHGDDLKDGANEDEACDQTYEVDDRGRKTKKAPKDDVAGSRSAAVTKKADESSEEWTAMSDKHRHAPGTGGLLGNAWSDEARAAAAAARKHGFQHAPPRLIEVPRGSKGMVHRGTGESVVIGKEGNWSHSTAGPKGTMKVTQGVGHGALHEHLGGDKHAKFAKNQSTNTGERTMATKQQFGTLRGALVANCSCEQGKKVLNELSEEALESVLNTAARRGEDGVIVFNAKKSQDDEDEEDAEDSSVMNADLGDDLEDKDTKDKSKKRDDPKVPNPGGTGRLDVKNRDDRKIPQLTENEWLAMAPPSVRERDRLAQEILNQRKAETVKRLVANVADAKEKKVLANELMARDYEELRKLARLLPGKPVANEARFPTIYPGDPPDVTANVEVYNSEDQLGVPDINDVWNEAQGNRAAAEGRTAKDSKTA